MQASELPPPPEEHEVYLTSEQYTQGVLDVLTRAYQIHSRIDISASRGNVFVYAPTPRDVLEYLDLRADGCPPDLYSMRNYVRTQVERSYRWHSLMHLSILRRRLCKLQKTVTPARMRSYDPLHSDDVGSIASDDSALCAGPIYRNKVAFVESDDDFENQDWTLDDDEAR